MPSPARLPLSAIPAGLPLVGAEQVSDDLQTRQPANDGKLMLVMMNPGRYVTVALAAACTGLTAKAIRRKIEDGKWLEDQHWRRAPDGGIFIDMKGFERWVEGTE